MSLCVTDTRGRAHSELTAEFAAIRSEMEAVAACFDGCKVLGQVREQDFWARLPALRAQCGDRACLRAAHFFRENARTLAEDRAPPGGPLRRIPGPGTGERPRFLRPLPERLQRRRPAPPGAFRWRWPSASTFWRAAAVPGGCRGAASPAPSRHSSRRRALRATVPPWTACSAPAAATILTLREQGGRAGHRIKYRSRLGLSP